MTNIPTNWLDLDSGRKVATAEALLMGEAEICIHQISEILAVKG
jgi:hypothetical protein